MKSRIVAINVIILFFSFQFLFAQNISFHPESDTIKAIDGCTGPVINCTLKSTSQCDSIQILPGFNTYFEYKDSNGFWRSTPNCFFVISDSINNYEYDLWYIPYDSIYDSQLIPFDSLFYTFDFRFELKLLLKSRGIYVDSLIQFFIAEYGLDIEESQNNNASIFQLYPNYPNPFNSTTFIKYYLSKKSNVNISIYDISGKLIETLLNEIQNSGIHAIKWNAHNQNSGVYFIRVISEGETRVTKSILLK